MKVPPPPSDAEYWLERAEEVLSFLRKSQLVGAIDMDVWFFKGNANDQLAAFLQSSTENARPVPDIRLGRHSK